MTAHMPESVQEQLRSSGSARETREKRCAQALGTDAAEKRRGETQGGAARLDVLVEALNLLFRLEAQLLLGGHGLLQRLPQPLLRLQLLDQMLALRRAVRSPVVSRATAASFSLEK